MSTSTAYTADCSSQVQSQSLDEAAKAAQQLASSTNSSASSWPMPFSFSPHVPPPGYPSFGGYGGYYGMQGLNFSAPNYQPSAIPQMVQPGSDKNKSNATAKNSNATGNPNAPPGFTQNFSQTTSSQLQQSYSASDYYMPVQQHSVYNGNANTANGLTSYQQWAAQNAASSTNGPKPIRFSLQQPTKRQQQPQTPNKIFNGAAANIHDANGPSSYNNVNSSINQQQRFQGNNVNKQPLISQSPVARSFRSPAVNPSTSNTFKQPDQQQKRGPLNFDSNYPTLSPSISPSNSSLGSNLPNFHSQNLQLTPNSKPNSSNIISNKVESSINRSWSPTLSNVNGFSGGGGDRSTGSSDSYLSQQQLVSALDPSEWPDSLQKYVMRCYELCSSDVDKDRVEIILKGKVTRAATAGILQSKDWSKEPLPEMSDGQIRMLPFAPIQGIIKGRPIKPDLAESRADRRGNGRRGAGGRGRGSLTLPNSSDIRQKNVKGSKSIRGGRGRNFRSRSKTPSRSRSSGSSSRSRSSSKSSDSSFNDRKNRRRRRSSSDNGNYTFSNSAKKQKVKASNRKGRRGAKNAVINKHKSEKGNIPGKQQPVHMYSEYGLMRVDGECSSSVKLTARAARFAKEGGSKGKGRQTMKNRLGGFVDRSIAVSWAIDAAPAFDESDWTNSSVIGTCCDLEKRYLRLTSAPDPSTIRPVRILKQSLHMVKQKWKDNQDYFYACDQLKAIRQDLTVQRIRNDFTVEVYETHARISLEKGDHEEFNQCQSQLVQLYKSVGSTHEIEFTAYRILYYVFTANTLDLGALLSSLTAKEKEDQCIAHALEVRNAWALKNYPRFFRLHSSAPKMSGYLIDWFANRERKTALKVILKAYRPSVPISFVKDQLGLLDHEWTDFLSATSLEPTIIYQDSPHNTKINAKESFPLLVAAL